MQDVFSIVRPACDFAGVLESDAQVTVVDGRIQARNSQLVVSHPVDLDDFAVPCADLDFALRKVGECTASIGENFITLKSGAGSTRIKRLGGRPAFAKPKVETKPIPVGLIDAFDEVFAFTTGDKAKPWSVGARIDDNTVTATNSIMLARAELDEPSGIEGLTVSRAAIAYMRSRRASLKSWGVDENNILIEFDDGGWCAAARLNAEMPDQAVGLIEAAVAEWDPASMQEVSSEYRAAFLSSVDHTETLLELFEDHIYGARLSTEHKCKVETTLGENVPAMFTAKDLTTVITVAARIGFDRYPSPVPFITKNGTKGLIAGRRNHGEAT